MLIRFVLVEQSYHRLKDLHITESHNQVQDVSMLNFGPLPGSNQEPNQDLIRTGSCQGPSSRGWWLYLQEKREEEQSLINASQKSLYSQPVTQLLYLASHTSPGATSSSIAIPTAQPLFSTLHYYILGAPPLGLVQV